MAQGNPDKSEESEYIDVAGNAKYQNQSKAYYNEFLNWRSSGHNPYAYSFVRRKSEHSYVDGQGFVSRTPQETERRVLRRCCRLIAMTMFSIIIFTVAEMIYCASITAQETFSLSKITYSQQLSEYDVTLLECAILCGIRVLKYLIPILIFILDTKIPKAVMLPKADKTIPDMAACAFVMALMATVFCRIAAGMLSQICENMGLEVYRTDYIYSSDILSTLLFGLCHCVIISVLTEILFRGLILQTFRQFGDMFAFVVCCTAESFSSFDLSSLGYSLFLGIMITLFTLRTGSIKVAMGMRISSAVLVYALNIIDVYVPQNMAAITENIVCFIIIAVSLTIYAKVTTGQNFSFNVDSSKTHLSIPRKLVIFLSDNLIMLWLIIILSGGIFILVN